MTHILDLIDISRPLAYDHAAGGYAYSETISGMRVRMALPAKQTKTYSKTGVEYTAPSDAMIRLLQMSAEYGQISPRNGHTISVTTMRAAAKRGLGDLFRDPRIKARVVGFRINDKGRRVLEGK